MFNTWTYTAYGETNAVSVDTDRRLFIRSESPGYGQDLAILFQQDGAGYIPAHIRREIFLAMAEEPEFASATVRERWTLRFWKRFTGAPEAEFPVPHHLLHVIATPFFISSRFQHDGRHGDLIPEMWSDWLWNGNRIPGLSLDMRRSYRDLLLSVVPELRTDAVPVVFPLMDYSRIAIREWREASGWEGDELTFLPDGVTVAGWDNPRDGGSQTISYEQLWMYPSRHIWRHLKSHTENILNCLRPAIIDPILPALPETGNRSTDR